MPSPACRSSSDNVCRSLRAFCLACPLSMLFVQSLSSGTKVLMLGVELYKTNEGVHMIGHDHKAVDYPCFPATSLHLAVCAAKDVAFCFPATSLHLAVCAAKDVAFVAIIYAFH